MSIQSAMKKVSVALAALEHEMQQRTATHEDPESLSGAMYFEITCVEDCAQNQRVVDRLEAAFVGWLRAELSKATGRRVMILDDGHDNSGNLLCKFSVRAGDLPKIIDLITTKSSLSEGIIYSPDTSRTFAASGWTLFVDSDVHQHWSNQPINSINWATLRTM